MSDDRVMTVLCRQRMPVEAEALREASAAPLYAVAGESSRIQVSTILRSRHF